MLISFIIYITISLNNFFPVIIYMCKIKECMHSNIERVAWWETFFFKYCFKKRNETNNLLATCIYNAYNQFISNVLITLSVKLGNDRIQCRSVGPIWISIFNNNFKINFATVIVFKLTCRK